MKNKWMIKVFILMMVGAICPAVCRAQVIKQPEPQTTPLAPHRITPKINTAKLKAASPAAVRPKITQPIDMQMVKEKKAHVSPSDQGAIQLTKKPAETGAHPLPSVNDSPYPVTHVLLSNPPSPQNKSGRHAINPQPLPPKTSPDVRKKGAQLMINQQPLPPKTKPFIHHKISH